MLDGPDGKSAPIPLGLRCDRDASLQKGSGKLCAVLFEFLWRFAAWEGGLNIE